MHEFLLVVLLLNSSLSTNSKAITRADRLYKIIKTTLDNIITKIKEASEAPYDILNNYIIYLQANSSISTSTLKTRIIAAKNFLEYYYVEINPRKFKPKAKPPKVIRKGKEALSIGRWKFLVNIQKMIVSFGSYYHHFCLLIYYY